MADNSSKTALLIIGTFFVIMGVLAGGYTIVVEEDRIIFDDVRTEKPYENYSIPLIIAGIALILVGAVLAQNETTTRTVHEIHERPVKERVIVKKKR